MLTKENLLSVICFVSGESENAIRGNLRYRNLVLARHIYFYIARNIMGLKLVEIGQYIGRDHTTVMHGLNRIGDMVFTKDVTTLNMLDQVTLLIKEKYLIPTKIFVSIPDTFNVDEIINNIQLMGCSIERL
jgi:chromosomal replication initiation ATPase DnaA